ncbi:hypothetical protein TNCV_1367551 [Trichonephila clavipes]|nr:hypothetical protein TNCV_1367551 [Trichonephila clavipes]
MQEPLLGSDRAKEARRSSAPIARNELKPALLAEIFFEIHSSKIYGGMDSMMSILDEKANSFIAEIAFSADCEDYLSFLSGRKVNVKI